MWDVPCSLGRWMGIVFCCHAWRGFAVTLIELFTLILVIVPVQWSECVVCPFGPRVSIPVGFIYATSALALGASAVVAASCVYCFPPTSCSRGGGAWGRASLLFSQVALRLAACSVAIEVQGGWGPPLVGA